MTLRSTIASAALCLLAQTATSEPLQILQPYIRQAPPTATSTTFYMQLHNPNDQPRVLVSITGDIAPRIELHEHQLQQGLMHMQAIPAIELPAHSTTRLEPGKLHGMLMELKRPLQAGEQITLQLHFADGSTQTLAAPVEPPSPIE